MSKTELIFAGSDPDLAGDIWVSDGTSAGTYQVTGRGNLPDLDPRNITLINPGLALFNGEDSNGVRALYRTNGTAAGTVELKGIKYAWYQGIGAGPAIAYNGKMIFSGEDSTQGRGLWISNGTVAGTVEIGGKANAGIKHIQHFGTDNFNPTGFVAFKGKILFNGIDDHNQLDLWFTNGTAAGTYNLANVKGQSQGGLNPTNICVLGSRAFFAGQDQTDTHGGLWVTNGTVAGTVEIGGQLSHGVKGYDPGFGIEPTDITRYEGKVYFSGYDNTRSPNGNLVHSKGLWVSNGTAGGTTELVGIKGQNTRQNGGLFYGVPDPDFTYYNGRLWFAGRDATGGSIGLWSTDGTVAGTREFGGLRNGYVRGANHSGLLLGEGDDLTVYNGKLYFSGHDANGNIDLWVTDATLGGTKEIYARNSGPYGLIPTDKGIITVPSAAQETTASGSSAFDPDWLKMALDGEAGAADTHAAAAAPHSGWGQLSAALHDGTSPHGHG